MWKPWDNLHFVQTNDGWIGVYVNGEFKGSQDTSSIYYWLEELGIPYTSSEEGDHPKSQSDIGFDFESVEVES